jgi:hypothetical protein
VDNWHADFVRDAHLICDSGNVRDS